MYICKCNDYLIQIITLVNETEHKTLQIQKTNYQCKLEFTHFLRAMFSYISYYSKRLRLTILILLFLFLIYEQIVKYQISEMKYRSPSISQVNKISEKIPQICDAYDPLYGSYSKLNCSSSNFTSLGFEEQNISSNTFDYFYDIRGSKK